MWDEENRILKDQTDEVVREWINSPVHPLEGNPTVACCEAPPVESLPRPSRFGHQEQTTHRAPRPPHQHRNTRPRMVTHTVRSPLALRLKLVGSALCRLPVALWLCLVDLVRAVGKNPPGAPQ